MVNIIYKFINIFQFIILIEDTNLFCTSKGIVSLSVTICNELIKLDKLYDFFPKVKSNKIQISFCNKLISKVNGTNFLGVIINDQLNRYSHIKQIVLKLHNNYYVMKRASWLLSTSSLTVLYKSLCLPYMLYCYEIWSRTSRYFLEWLEWSTELGI